MQLIVVLICMILTSLGFLYAAIYICILNYVMIQRSHEAYRGDAEVSKKLILPCYKPLLRSLILFHLACAILVTVAFCINIKKDLFVFQIIQYCAMCSALIFSIPPLLLIQPSISNNGFLRILSILLTWFIINSIAWILSIQETSYGWSCQVTFLITSFLLPWVLSLGIRLKYIKSRIQFESISNQAGVLLLSFATSLFLLFNIFYVADLSLQLVYLGLTLSLLVSNLLFPWTMHCTLVADTKYWRGLGRHNRDIFRGIDAIQTPNMTVEVASSEMQDIVQAVNEGLIDFASLQIGELIGSGASANVYFGKFNGVSVAIKTFCPSEVTTDSLEKIRAEYKIISQLSHRNVVRFYGICVRPPRIALVSEYCAHGSLRECFKKFKDKWSPLRKVRAAADAACGLAYFHSHGYLHRDVKSDNFFVDRLWNVKLGDFGECKALRQSLMNPNVVKPVAGRMTIIGTVAYLAPELIRAEKQYTAAIDIYGLGVTMWEIWCQDDAFKEYETFALYDKVLNGERPPLPAIPDSQGKNHQEEGEILKKYVAIMEEAWSSQAELRPTASNIFDRIEAILAYAAPHQNCENPDRSSNHVFLYENSLNNTHHQMNIANEADTTRTEYTMALNNYEPIGNITGDLYDTYPEIV